jgi:uncharacterized Zn ribbon protein
MEHTDRDQLARALHGGRATEIEAALRDVISDFVRDQTDVRQAVADVIYQMGMGDIDAGVISVNGRLGTVVLTQDAIPDGNNAKQFSIFDKAKLDSVAIGATANQTDAFLVSRANHTGTQSADTIVNGVTNKVLTAAEKAKLTSMNAGATVNSPDSFLLNRANHTGTQSAATISDLSNVVRSILADISIAVSSVNGQGGDVVLDLDDILAGQLNKHFTEAEKVKLLGIASGATANNTDAFLTNRANHTGTQSSTTIADFDTAVATNTFVAAATAARHTHANKSVLDNVTAAYTTTEQTKLAGIAPNATANASDAQLRDRSTHTGTQAPDTIDGLAETILDTVGNSLIAGDNISIVYDDEGDTVNFVVSATSGAVSSVNGQTGIVALDQDDIPDGTTAKQFTATEKTKLSGIATGATANSTDAQLRSRATHTGTQTASTISDFDLAVSQNTTVQANTTARHSHTNKALLDSYNRTNEEISNAVAIAHSHTNGAVLNATTASFTTALKTKLDGIATGATANDTDANLRSRATHTGTQPSTTISDFAEAVRDTMGVALVAGTNITITPDDAANTITINSTASTSGEVESVNGQIGIVVLDQDDILDGTTAKQFTATEKTKLAGIATAATANSTDAQLRDRATHTGTQLSSTISNFQTSVSANTDVAANTTARHTHTNKTILDAVTAAFTTADETKLDGIQAGATVNATDAALRDRTTHTGTQPSTTISDFSEAVRDTMGLALVAGDNVTITPDDNANTITITSVAGGQVDSVNGQTGNVTLTQDDVADGLIAKQFTVSEETKLAGIAAGATVNDTDAALRDRSTHTGTQTASTISDFQTTVSANATVAANTAARHTHTNQAVLDATTASFTLADESKLDGVQAGATANASDSSLRDRSTHTGTQTSNTISDLSETILERVGGILQAGANVTLTPNTETDTITIAAIVESGMGEVNSVNGATGVVTLDTDDIPSGTVTSQYTNTEKTKLAGIQSGATANATDAQLRDRSTHTGTQLASTISDFQTAVSANADLVALVGHDHDADYAALVHDHDGRYYTETEVNTLLTGKSDTTHNHDAEYATIGHDHDLDYALIAHGHVIADVTGLQTALDGKAATTHNHDLTYAPIVHTHDEYATDADLTAGLATKSNTTHIHDDRYYTETEVDDALVLKANADHTHADLVTDAEFATALAGKSDTTHNHDTVYAALSHGHVIADVTGLQAALDAKAAAGHNHDSAYAALVHGHVIGDVTGLQTALDGKASTSHNHDLVYSAIGHTHSDLVTDAELATALSGKADTVHDHDTRYYTETETDTLLAGKANTVHTHDDRYFTESEVTTLLAGKSDTTHNHDAAYAVIGHNHDSAYASITHDHDTDYAALVHDHDGRYYTETEVDDALVLKADADHLHTGVYAPVAHDHDLDYAAIGHLHDDRYFTETEVTDALAAKANVAHMHAIADTTGLQAALDGKAATVHNHDAAYAALVHGHAITDVTGLQTALDGKAATGHDHDLDYAAIDHTHADLVTDGEFATALAGKSDIAHTHDGRYYTETEVDTFLAGKSDTTHNHDAAYAALGHNHDADYADIAHNHDLDYADIAHLHDGRYYTETEIDTALALKSDTTHNHAGVYAPTVHDHDSRYYTETEIDTALAGKANTTHAHAIADVTNLQSSLDGKASSTHNHDLVYAAIGHNHDAAYSALGHNHDDRYFTESEVTTALAGKSDTGHTHTAANVTDFNTAADARITAQKGVASGLATLDGSGKIPTTQIPPIAMTDVSVVASQAAQLALTSQEGDVVIRTDLNRTYIHNGGSAGTMADWTEMATPTDVVQSVNGQTGVVTLTTTNVNEGTNLYYTEARVNANTNVAANTSARHSHSNKATLDAVTAAFTTALNTKLTGIETGADVTDAANVDAAGAVMNTDTTTAAMQFVVDEDSMTSNSATKVPTQQSVKAYVDTGLATKASSTHNHDATYAALVHDHDSRYYTETEIDTALAGKANTAHDHDTRYYTETEVDTLLADKSNTTHNHDASYAPLVHNHDTLYYTESEVDTLLAGKSATSHTHVTADVTGLDTALAGKAASSHTHHVNDLTATGTKSTTTFLRGDNTWATPPNTTYAVPTQAEAEAGTATTGRAFSAQRVNQAIQALAPVKAADLATKANVSHTHVIGDTTGLQAALDGKASTTHNHDATYAALAHTHAIADTTGLQAALDGKASTTHNHDAAYAAIGHNHDAAYAALVHDHDTRYYTETEVDTLLGGKANSSHTHAISDVTNYRSEIWNAMSHTSQPAETEIGSGADAGTATASVAIGNNAQTLEANSVAIGQFAAAHGESSTVIGDLAYAMGDRGFAIGANAEADNADEGVLRANSVKIQRSNGTGATTLNVAAPDGTAKVLGIGNDNIPTINGVALSIPHNHDATYAAISHTHVAANITDFDTEVSNNTDVTANTAARHSHANKALLDTYAQTEVNLADAVAKKHSHSNQAVLDATTASYTTALNTKLSGIEALADVTDAANVDAAGAVMNSDTTTASMSFVVDEDAMTSNSATKVPTQQSVKAYVDTGLSGKANTSHTHTAANITDFSTAADARITAQKGNASGLATLDAGGKIPSTQLPAIGLTDVNVVASQAAQLALTAQEGDVAIRSDLNRSYIHNGGTAGTMADWTELATPTDAVQSVNGQTGAVSLTTTNINEGTNLYYTEARVNANTNVAANTAARHSHSNKALLDTYTQTEANLADAVSKKHSHANQATLDATTASYTTALNTKLTGIEALADVTDAANVDAAGAVMNSDTTTASMSFVVNENNMVSNSTTKVPTQASVKSYVDTGLAGKAASSHSHAISDVTNLQTTLDGKASSTHNHDATYAALSHTHTAANVTDFAEVVRDTMGTALVAGSNITITPNDVGDTITIAATSTAPVTSVNTLTGAVTLTQDNIGDGTTYKQYSQTEKSKLAGIEAGADVTDAANVDAAGAVMNSDTSTASMSFVIDEDAMTTNTATKVPTQQSVKAYVDAGLATKAATSHNHDATYAALSHTHDDRYYTESEMATLLNAKAGLVHTHAASELTATGTRDATTFLRGDNTWQVPPLATHTHDDRYYTETEINSQMSGKANSVHSHAAVDVIDFAETVRDTMGAALVGGTGITVTPNDVGDTITITNNASVVTVCDSASAASTASTTSTTVYATALSTNITLPAGTWTVNAIGGLLCTHSASGTVNVQTVIAGDAGTARAISGVSSSSPNMVVDNAVKGGQSGTITCLIQYKSSTAGTTAAKNPWITIIAERTA